MLTFQQALKYLKETRGIVVSRQTLHTYARRYRDKCQVLDGGETRPALWLMPTSLLDNYPQPSARHQQNGRGSKKA